MTILNIGTSTDEQVDRVRAVLADRDVPTRIIWPGDWKDACPTLSTDGIRFRDGVVNGVRSVWLRNLELSPLSPVFEHELADAPVATINKAKERNGLLLSILRVLEARGVAIINPTETLPVHQLKPWQLHVFRNHGLPTPASLTTIDPAQVRAFATVHAEVVYKPVAGGGYARLLTTDDLGDDRLALLGNVPVLFQERIHGDNLRVYVLEGRVVAAGRIVSEQLDYRRGDHTVEIVDLAPALADAAVTATQALGLRFSGVDIITNGDRFAVLEANPSPMFAGFDRLAGTDVAGALARTLAEPDSGAPNR